MVMVNERLFFPAFGGAVRETKPIKTMNDLKLKGDWNKTKGKLKQKWGQLTDDDLNYVEGKEDELIGRIQRKTGETRENVERALRD